MKVDLIFIHSIAVTSTAPITEYLKKHTYFVYTLLICNKACKAYYINLERRQITQSKLDILSFQNLSTFCKRSDSVKNEYCFSDRCIILITLKKGSSFKKRGGILLFLTKTVIAGKIKFGSRYPSQL